MTKELTARQMSYIEHEWMSKLGPDAFDAHLAFYRRAFLAEVEDTPSRRTANSKQIELGTQAVQQAARDRIDRLPNSMQLYRALGDTQGSEANYVCDAVLEFLRSYADLKGPMRGWALTAYAGELSK